MADRDTLPSSCAACLYWETDARLPRECGAVCDGARATGWVRTVAAEWGECGRVAVEDGEVLGFIKYAPPSYVPQARHLPAGPPLPDTVVITCMHLSPTSRHHGLGGVLLREALRDLSGRGERSVQAYAVANSRDWERSPMVGVEFLLRHGFTVAKPHFETPLLRLDLKALASWADNLEAVLDSLRLPMRAPRRAPVPLAVPREDGR